MNTELDKRTPWPFTPMTTPASSAQNAQPLAKRINPKRRLTEDEKNRIFELHGQGMSNTAIGKEIGCTDVAVGYALKKRNKAQQQAADAVPPEAAIEIENPQQNTWTWFNREHPRAVAAVEIAMCDMDNLKLVDSFLRGYLQGVGLDMESRDAVIFDFHVNYLGL